MSSTKTKCNNKEFQNQIDELKRKNEELQAKCLSYESEILTLRADAKSKQEFMDKVDDLSHRICRIIEQKKNDQSKHIECQQLDRNFFDTKIRELTADLQVAHDSINDLKSIIHQQDQTNKQDIIRYQNEIERLKSDERNALSAAGNYFKTYFLLILTFFKIIANPTQLSPNTIQKPSHLHLLMLICSIKVMLRK